MKTKLLQLRRRCAGFVLTLAALGGAGTLTAHAGAPPVVSNVVVAPVAGTKNVAITYDVADPDSAGLTISIGVSSDSGTTWVPARTFLSGSAVGNVVVPGTGKLATWNAGVDMNNTYNPNCKVRVVANDKETEYFVLIPAGSFQMGNSFHQGGTTDPASPVHSVNVSDFYMEKTLVTGRQWNSVHQYALVNGYSFSNPGSIAGANYPVYEVGWFDAVKWCNARSELAGRTPVYYTDAGLTAIYKSGHVTNPYVNWSANGYRLPTEAEWEKAARGGLSGKRFPWGDTISQSQANYYSTYPNTAYDLGPSGRNPAYSSFPYTSPVDTYPANGYGLYDMSGNVNEWCWDWFDFSYYVDSGPWTDPVGPSGPAQYRVLRGGSAYSYTGLPSLGCADRNANTPDSVAGLFFVTVPGINYPDDIGFRCVRGQ